MSELPLCACGESRLTVFWYSRPEYAYPVDTRIITGDRDCIHGVERCLITTKVTRVIEKKKDE